MREVDYLGTCPKCGKALVNTCPICNKPAELYSRVVGYLRPVQTWNDGKQQEYLERTPYTNIERKKYIVNEQWHQE